MSSTKIRPLKREDESEWKKLFLAYHEYYQIKPDEKVIDTTFARFMDDKEPMHASLAIGEKGKPIGFLHWVYHRSTLAVNDYLYLHDLFVSENVRSRGVGRSLIEHVYQDADKHDAARVYWQTKVSSHKDLLAGNVLIPILLEPKHDNHRAQLLYVKAGYKNGFVCYQRPGKE